VTVTDADDVSDPTPFVDTKTHHSTFDVEREAPSLALVEAIAAAKGTDPLSLDPVGDAVDLGALDTIIESRNGDHSVEVTVDTLGVRATIGSGGTIAVQQAIRGTADGESGDQ